MECGYKLTQFEFMFKFNAQRNSILVNVIINKLLFFGMIKYVRTDLFFLLVS